MVELGKSHFPIDLGVLTAIRQLTPQGSTIVELGSGNGTNRLTKEFKVYSIEDDKKWIGYCEDSNYIHAPLVEIIPHHPVLSSSLEVVQKLMSGQGPTNCHKKHGSMSE